MKWGVGECGGEQEPSREEQSWLIFTRFLPEMRHARAHSDKNVPDLVPALTPSGKKMLHLKEKKKLRRIKSGGNPTFKRLPVSAEEK